MNTGKTQHTKVHFYFHVKTLWSSPLNHLFVLFSGKLQIDSFKSAMGKTIFVVTQWRRQQVILPASFTILSRTQSSIVPLDITGFISSSRARKLNIHSLKLKIQCHLQIAQGRNITYLLSQNIFLTKQMPLLW